MNTKIGIERTRGRTRKQVYDFLIKYLVENNGRAPSHREIANGANISSTNTVSYQLVSLEEIGLIQRTAEKSRQTRIPGSVYALPRNVIAGNINKVTETSVFIDRNSEHAAALMSKFGESDAHTAHWYQDNLNWRIATLMLHHEQLAVITDNPKITLMAIAHEAAVYLPENVLNG